jgi:thermitase
MAQIPIPKVVYVPVMLGLLTLMSACGTNKVPTPTAAPATPATLGGYLLTLEVGSSDTQEALVQKYGGEVQVWQPEAGLAILKLSDKAVANLRGSGVSVQNTSLEPIMPASVSAVSASGWSAWAGGWSAWAGGWSAWAGGWSAWAGGVGSAAPVENANAWNQISLRQAHAISRNFGQGIKVAVLDTGVDVAHPAFTGRLAPAAEWYDFADNDNNPREKNVNGKAYGHGTAVASLILQVAPRATILPIRVLGTEGEGDTDKITRAIQWAVDRGANVINISAGSIQYSRALHAAAAAANNKGILIVASAGNYGQVSTVTFPGALSWNTGTTDTTTSSIQGTYMRTIGIGSVDANNNLSKFTSYGTNSYGSAPGEGILAAYPTVSIYPNVNRVAVTGTSFATPLFAGAIALALSDMPNVADRARMSDFLYRSLRDDSNLTTLVNGNRLLNVERLLRGLPGWSAPVYNIVNVNSGLCLEVPNASTTANAPLGQTSCLNAKAAQWRLVYAPSGNTVFYGIQNVTTGLAVGIDSALQTDGARAQQQPMSTTLGRQMWQLNPSGDSYTLKVKHSSKCLGVVGSSKAGGAAIEQNACTTGAQQQWRLKLVN